MKKQIVRPVTLLILLTGLCLPVKSVAQDPPPPPAQHGQNINQPPGGGAPIGEGLWVLLAGAAFYAIKKRNQKQICTLQ